MLPGGTRLPAAGAGWRGVFLFGIGYAIASLSCTLPIFLVVVGTALAAGGLVGGIALFLSYSLGMGLVLTTLTVLAAIVKGAVARWLRQVAPYIERVSAAMLIGAGAYLVIYWVPSLVAS